MPVGLERVLFSASQDPAFRAELLRDAEQAVRARGMTLRDSEWAMLRAVPAARLLATAEGFDTSPENVARRGFMRAVAAGAVALAAAGCDTVDVPENRFDSQGIRPYEAGLRPRDAAVDLPVTRYDSQGIRPDEDWMVPPFPDAAPPDADPGDGTGDTVDLEVAGPDATGIRPDGMP